MGWKFWQSGEEGEVAEVDGDQRDEPTDSRTRQLLRDSVRCPGCGQWGSSPKVTIKSYTAYECPAPRDQCRVDTFRVYEFKPSEVREWNAYHAEEGEEIPIEEVED